MTATNRGEEKKLRGPDAAPTQAMRPWKKGAGGPGAAPAGLPPTNKEGRVKQGRPKVGPPGETSAHSPRGRATRRARPGIREDEESATLQNKELTLRRAPRSTRDF